ncbi:MAG TPA: hypothetical protein VE258_08265 [Ktedonobacterales bacterium]|nr:hypothetical protein [Ktedonobacterales bacterium]
MGKGLSFILACGSLSLLALFFATGTRNPLQDALLLAGCMVLSALAWVVAFGTSLVRAVRFGRGWHAVWLLAAFLWLPVLPVLAYNVLALAAALVRARRRRPARMAAAAKAPAESQAPVRPDDVLLSWPHALKDEVHA